MRLSHQRSDAPCIAGYRRIPLRSGTRSPRQNVASLEVVHAAVVLASETSAEAIQAFCREQITDFKVPERIFIADSLQRTATGKIQRRHVATAFKE